MIGWLGIFATCCGGSRSAPPQEPESGRAAEGGVDVSPGAELPPELSRLLDSVACVTRVTGRLEDHRIAAEGQDGKVDILLLQPGEKLCLDGPVGDLASRTVPPFASQEIAPEAAAGRLITLELATVRGDAVLAVKNHHDGPLMYRALMKLPGQEDPKPTSICPVRPGLGSIEHWPHPVELLAIGDFHLLAPGEPLTCR